jgi:membrane protease YdiL (CAAX protease family)
VSEGMKKNYRELINRATDKELQNSLYLTQVMILIISFILGLFLFDDLAEFIALFIWDLPQIILWGGIAGVAVVLLDLILMKLLPSHYYDDGGLNERIFRNRSISQIAFIAAIVAVPEELLFRGIIQTHFGLIAASIIFAIVHYRYLFNWYLFLNVIGLSFFIGYVYLQTNNILVTIFMHFLIDFLLGCHIKQQEQEGNN